MNNHGHTTCTVHILVCTYTLLVTGGIYGTCSVRSCIIHKCFWFQSRGALRGIGISQIELTVWFYHVLCIHVAAPLLKKALHNHYNNSASYAGCGITFFPVSRFPSKNISFHSSTNYKKYFHLNKYPSQHLPAAVLV